MRHVAAVIKYVYAIKRRICDWHIRVVAEAIRICCLRVNSRSCIKILLVVCTWGSKVTQIQFQLSRVLE